MTKGARKELLFAVAKTRDVWYNTRRNPCRASICAIAPPRSRALRFLNQGIKMPLKASIFIYDIINSPII